MSKSRRSNRRGNTRRNRRNRRNVTRRGGFFGKLFKKSSPAPAAAAPVKTRNNRIRNAGAFVNAEMAKGKQPYHIYMNARNNGGTHYAWNIKNYMSTKGINTSSWV